MYTYGCICIHPWFQRYILHTVVATTGSALSAASDIHRQMPTYMALAGVRRDWLTNQNTDWCFVVIGLCTRQSHSPLQQLKIDPVCQLGPPYWLAFSVCQRIFINIRGQCSIPKNIYMHPWWPRMLINILWPTKMADQLVRPWFFLVQSKGSWDDLDDQSQHSCSPWFGHSANHGMCRPSY